MENKEKRTIFAARIIKYQEYARSLPFDDMLMRLRKKYDGYHFECDTIGVYNPFSLLNAFDSMTLKDYWFETGTPTFLVKLLRQSHYNLNNLARASNFSSEIRGVDEWKIVE